MKYVEDCGCRVTKYERVYMVFIISQGTINNSDLNKASNNISCQKWKSHLNKSHPVGSEGSRPTAQFPYRIINLSKPNPCYLRSPKMFHLFTSNELFPLSPKYHLVIKPAEVLKQTSSVTHFNWGFSVRLENCFQAQVSMRQLCAPAVPSPLLATEFMLH